MNKVWLLILPLLLAISVIAWSSHSVYKEIYPDSKENKQIPASTDTKQNTQEQKTGSNSISTGQVVSTGGTSSSASTTSPNIVYPQEPSEEKRTYCPPESRDVENCGPNDHPICGWFDSTKISCKSGPCVRSTFPNECEACLNPTILYWTENECPLHG